jgi:flagellar motor switch protein FliN/FliY
MPAIDPGTPLQCFVDSFRQAACEVFSQAFGVAWSVEAGTEERTSPPEISQVSFALSVSGALQGSAILHMQNNHAAMLAQSFLGEPTDASAELNDDRKQAVEELLRQVAGVAATAMKGRFGELQLPVEITGAPTPPQFTFVLSASGPSGDKLPIEFCLAPELLASISSKSDPVLSEPVPSDDRVASEAEPSSVQEDIGRFMDVKLDLSLRFGERLLALRELLGLNSGSVVELNRQVQEPVDLLLGGKVLAKGEVVVVDGSYGIRITEVLQARCGAV